MIKKTQLPTKKWWVAQVTAFGAFLVALITNDWQLSSELQVMLVGLGVEAAATWLVPNADTPGGVPVKRDDTPAVVEPGGGSGV